MEPIRFGGFLLSGIRFEFKEHNCESNYMDKLKTVLVGIVTATCGKFWRLSSHVVYWFIVQTSMILNTKSNLKEAKNNCADLPN